MKFCTKCGAQLNDDDLFCYRCGTKCVSIASNEEVTPEVKEEVKPTPVAEQKVVEEEKPIEVVNILENKHEKEEIQVNNEQEVAPIEVEEPVVEEKEETLQDAKDSSISNQSKLIFTTLIFDGSLLVLSLIYWFIGAFTPIHIAIKVIALLVALGLVVLPTINLIKFIIYMIKNKKFNLFLILILAISEVLMFVLISLNISALAS